ncbi:MAG: Asp-tRNA(Asn)/Glu-tRNA(Gln) amidotransferase subunit GatC [Candidatus Sericytochromatia bacterium]|nr:Asp-tRNA(Asn)/Glu-tRNA(Gln) amidotransferase subunit GatC [Candidatus Sericytochromatia bacterium]
MLDASDVRHVARLARLELADAEVEAQADQLGRILAFFDAMNAIDTTNVALTAHPFPVVNALRADVTRPSLARDAVLAGAPQTEGAFFRVPKILDG